jgi:hypothetical protein
MGQIIFLVLPFLFPLCHSTRSVRGATKKCGKFDHKNVFARIALQTFAVFFSVVLVDGRPERSSSSTEFRPSLKRLYHKKVFLWLMALSPKASCSIRWVSGAICFLRLKQNLMQILCSLKSGISFVKKNHLITKT